jgi:hypothetical protein
MAAMLFSLSMVTLPFCCFSSPLMAVVTRQHSQRRLSAVV